MKRKPNQWIGRARSLISLKAAKMVTRQRLSARRAFTIVPFRDVNVTESADGSWNFDAASTGGAASPEAGTREKRCLAPEPTVTGASERV